MSSHPLERLAALAAPLLERCVSSDAFAEALLVRSRAEVIGIAAGADADHLAVGRACAESEDGGAGMADAMLSELSEHDRAQLTAAVGEELARRIQVVCCAFVMVRLESTRDVDSVLDGADIPTLVAVGVGLGAVIA